MVGFQKSTLESNDLRNAIIYFGVCWSIWFLRWSSRVWASKSWEHGIAGLLGINSINWEDQIAVVTGGRSFRPPTTALATSKLILIVANRQSRLRPRSHYATPPERCQSRCPRHAYTRPRGVGKWRPLLPMRCLQFLTSL